MPPFPDISSKAVLDALVDHAKKERAYKLNKLASIEHDQWIYWTQGTAPMIKDLMEMLSAYMDCVHSNVPSEKNKQLVYESGKPYKTLHAAKERMDRWERLQKTPYAELTEEFKDDDRKWAIKALDEIERE